MRRTDISKLLERAGEASVSERVTCVARHLAGISVDGAEVREAIEALDESELETFGLSLFRLNLLSVLGRTETPERVRELATAAARARLWSNWEFHSHLRELTRQAPGSEDEARLEAWVATRTALEGWDVDRIRDVLREGRGAVICTPHIGAYRFAPSDLVMLGFRVTEPLLASTIGNTFNALNDPAYLRWLGSRLTLTNAESPGASVLLARALRRGEIVLIYVDGNIGSDRERVEDGWTTVQYLGHPVSVKSGAARLAGSMGAPLVPLITPRASGAVGRVVIGDPIVPEGALRGEALQRFADRAIQAVYASFEPFVLEAPETWESAIFMHRWRANASAGAEAVPDPASLREADIGEALARGARFRLDQRRVAEVVTGSHCAWVDVHTLKSFSIVPSMRTVAAALEGDDGVGAEWTSGATGIEPERVLHLLARLSADGLLQPNHTVA